MQQQKIVAVLGLGYVGLPLALGFGRKLSTIGYDLSDKKVAAYKKGFDPTGEMEPSAFQAAKQIHYTTDAAELKRADFVVVAVPTPVDDAKRPDLSPVESACRAVGANLKKGAIVVFESTVYPGVTEEICVPLLEKVSGLKCGPDFKVGYSPERINPGDKEHTLERIVKVVAGQDASTLEQVAWLYEQVVEAGVHRAASIKVAEAAKVIENTQRDLNIALMNELSLIFHRLGIDTADVLKAAGTKWNFLPFRPGLVGGHCIGVDPYYLTYKAEMLGYHPQVILAGRRINDNMGLYIAEQTVKMMIKADRSMKNPDVLVMGITFKENCADLRNSRVIDVIRELRSYGANVHVWDPLAEKDEAKHEYGLELTHWKDQKKYDAVVAAVSHKDVLAIDLKALAKLAGKGAPFMDVKSAFPRETLKEAGFEVWRL
jgi:UDP-N-acetyl-D-glucosamine/UDP-N-acetyl-D-galactosamine dehydrogenase